MPSRVLLENLFAAPREVQAYVKRARELAVMAAAPEQGALWDNLARDLYHLGQIVIQEF
jgi:hypothetical protein